MTSDNCPGQTWVQTAGLSSGSTFPVGTTTNTFVVTDAAGNTASCSFEVTVTDNEAPTIACAADVNVNNDPGVCGAVVTYDDPATSDNCPGETWVQTAGLASGSTFPVGTTTNTFVVTDAAGNTASCSFEVTVTDNEAPTIACAADVSVNNDPGVCGAVVTYDDPATSDNCPGQTWVQTAGLASGSIFPVGTTTNTFVVTDAAGNTASCSFEVTVTDNEAPTIACAADVNVNNDPGVCGAVVTYDDPATSDNCPGQTWVQTAGLASGATFPVGTTTNTFVVTDAAGNTASCSFEVTVTDNEAPTIACAADVSVNNDPGVCGAVVTYDDPATSDNCPGQTWVQTAGLASGSIFPVGTTINTFVVTDAAGNTASCSFEVTVTDNEAPTIACAADVNVNNDPGVCGAVVTYDDPATSDNCPGETWVQTAGLASGSTFPVGTTTNTFVVTDAAGNTASCSFEVTVTDNEAPTIACAADVNVNNDPGVCGAVVTYDDPATSDNCPGQTWVQTAGLASGATFPVGTTTNTFVVTDAAGNTATCSFEVTVTDNEAPTIACAADVNVNNDPGVCGAVVTYDDPATSDNCPGQTWVQTEGLASGSTFPVGTTTNTFVVTDAAGNTATCSFEVTVSDNEAPTIACAADVNVNNDPGVCGAVVTYDDPATSDNCPGQTWVQTEGLSSGSTFPVGTTTNTFVVTDAAGNTATCSFEVTVTDNEAPTIACAADVNVNNDPGVCGAVVTYDDPATSDNCPGQTWVQTEGLASGATFPVGTTTNTFVVTDAAGNTASCSFDVTVTDNEAPTIACAADVNVNNDPGVCGAVVTYDDPATSDNCPGQTWVQTAGLSSGSTFPVGTTINTFVVTDAAGNTATCSFKVTVTDNEAPTIACAADVNVNNDPGVCGAVVTYDDPATSDNCPGQTWVQTAGLASGATFPVGTTTNTFVVTDAAGNTASCSFEVTITDNEAPTIACAADVNVNNDPGVCGAVVTYDDPATSDNCPGQTWVQTAGLASGSTFPVGTTTNTFVVTDAAGNTASCSFEVTVTDNEAPMIVNPASDLTVECDGSGNSTDLQAWLDSQGGAEATDNCEIIDWSDDFTGLTDDCGLTGSAVVTFTVIDDFGNASTTTATFAIVDTTPPVVAPLATLTVECPEDVPAADISIVDATDICSALTVTYIGDVSDGESCAETLTRTYRVTDACGNFTEVDQIIITDDTTPPVLKDGADIPSGEMNIVACYSEIPSGPTVSEIADLYEDNCGAVHVEKSGTPSGDDCSWNVTYTYSIFDDCDNFADQVEISYSGGDTESPTLVIPDDVTVIGCDIDNANVGTATATDNCATQPIITYVDDEDGLNDCPGVILRTWTAEDACGNKTSAIQTITTIDEEAPVLVGVPDDVTLDCGEAPPIPNVTAYDTCDPNVEVTFSESSENTMEDVYVKNHSFEHPSLHDCEWTSDISGWKNGYYKTKYPGQWKLSNSSFAGAYNNPASYGYGGVAPDGDNIMYAISKWGYVRGLSQVLSETLAPDKNYTLTVLVGNPSPYNEGAGPDYRIELVAGGVVVATISGASPANDSYWLPIGLQYNSNDNPELHGEKLEIRLLAEEFHKGWELNFDRVKLKTSGESEILTRTWTAVDACGNTTTESQVIQVQEDTEPPMLTCPPDVSLSCDDTDIDPSNTGMATAEDNCGIAEITYTDVFKPNTPEEGFSCACEGGMVTLTVQYDGPANATVEAFYDSGEPLATFNNVQPGDWLTVDATSIGEDKLKSNTSFYVNGGPELEIHTSCSKYILGRVVGELTVIGWTDRYGSTCDQSVAPIEDCDCDGGMIELSVRYDGPAGATVNAFYYRDELLGTFTNVQPGDTLTVISWTVGENKLKSKTVFTVNGGPEREFHTSCSEDIAGQTIGEFTVVGWLDGDGQFCGYTAVAGDNGSSSTIIRTWTATDINGNESTCKQIIEIEGDQTPPEIECPADVTLACGDDNIDPHYTGMATATDNCDQNLLIRYSDAPLNTTEPGGCDCKGGMVTLTVQYNGPAGGKVTVYYDYKKKLATFHNVQPGEYLTVDARHIGKDKLKSYTSFYVNHGRERKIHTSCSRYILGQIVGEFTVKGWTDRYGNTCDSSQPPVENCECDKGMIELNVRYDGPAGAMVKVFYKSRRTLATFTDVQPGDTLSVNAWAVGMDKLKSRTTFEVNRKHKREIHTSCSQDIQGLTVGEFTVIGWLDGKGQVCGYSTVVNDELEDCQDIARTWTATDLQGNSSSCVQVIHFEQPASRIMTPGSIEGEELAKGQVEVETLSVKAYPNPFVSNVYIDFVVPQTTRVKLEVYNMTGKLVATLFDDVADPNVVYNNLFDVTNLSKGTYLYKLTAGDKTKTAFLIPVK